MSASLSQAKSKTKPLNQTKSLSEQGKFKQSHHLVFGAGLIGCYLGGALIRAQQHVSLLGRPRFLEQLEKQYVLSDYKGRRFNVQPSPRLVTNSEFSQVEQIDVLWLTVKCTMLQDAITDLQTHSLGPKTLIICCQNGVGTHEIIKKAFPHNKVIRAMVPFNVVNDEPGCFHRGSQGRMVLEVTPELESFTKWLASQLNSDILPVNISYDMTALQWAKLQLNLSNAVNALADIPVKQMLETPVYRKFIARLMQELLLVTEKQKIKLPKIANLPNKWIPKVLKLPNVPFKVLAQKMLAIDPAVKLSMWWDLQNNKPTEVDYINGKVVSQAQKLDISAPANQWIVSLIHEAQSGKRLSANAFKDAVMQFEKEQDT
uniref:2-dehydropantoate 2-reductase n=1 Tax=Ningiella ruwaisensis TaxID=2364274 RepID=UPI0014462FBB|nr:2-dehydropantoate 2-reductase [Ningiella ruwaisensis]